MLNWSEHGAELATSTAAMLVCRELEQAHEGYIPKDCFKFFRGGEGSDNDSVTELPVPAAVPSTGQFVHKDASSFCSNLSLIFHLSCTCLRYIKCFTLTYYNNGLQEMYPCSRAN